MLLIQNYGKFIAPISGTYQFITALYNDNSQVGAALHVNGDTLIQSRNGPAGGTGMLSIVAKLEKNDPVWLVCPVRGVNQLDRYFTFFSGHLISLKSKRASAFTLRLHFIFSNSKQWCQRQYFVHGLIGLMLMLEMGATPIC